ncbi:MAG TPA: flagellar filament capping protein FliD [Candidatus Binatia bacterium]
MSLPTINFSGLATGIDTGALIDALVKVERRPIDLLEFQMGNLEFKLSLFNDLNSKLAALKTAAGKLSTSASFFVKKASSSDDSVVSATAGSNASAGSHSITVTSLAQAATQASTGFSSPTSNIRQGTLNITVGTTTTPITIDGTNNTLDGLKNAINASGAAVTASIVQVDATTYRLVVTGKNTGTANAVTIDESGLTTGSDPLPGFTVTQAATNAVLDVDGIVGINRSTNTVSDVITGVTLDLKSLSAAPVQVAITNDTTAIKTQVNDFVKAYNDVMSFIHEQTKYDSKSKSGAPLIADSTTQSTQGILRMALGTMVAGNPASLADLGFTTNTDNTITVDDAKLTDALANNAAGVSNLFIDATNGVAVKLAASVDSLTAPSSGILTARIKGTQDSINDIEDNIAEKEDRLDQFAQALVRRFSVLEALVAKLKAQQDYLTKQLASLPQIT